MKSQPPRRSGDLKTIETLVTDIFSLFDKNVDEVSLGVSHDADRGGLNELYMSNLGKPLRQLYYDLTSAPNKEKLSGKTHFKFKYGHILEDLVLELAERAGHEVKDRQRRVEIDGVRGKIDAIIDGVLVDAKSCSPRAFTKFVNGTLLNDDPFGYVTQLSGYWAAIPECERAGFLAINKVDGELFFYELPSNKRQTLDDVQTRIATVRSTVAQGQEPERCYEPVPEGKSGNLRLGVGCSYCAHKYHCWRDANDGAGLKAYFYSAGPKFLVKTVREPKVPTEDVIDVFPTRGETPNAASLLTKQEGTE